MDLLDGIRNSFSSTCPLQNRSREPHLQGLRPSMMLEMLRPLRKSCYVSTRIPAWCLPWVRRRMLCYTHLGLEHMEKESQSLERAKWGKTYCTLWKKVLQEFKKNYSKQGAQEVTCSSEQKYGKRVWKTHRKKSTTRINQKAERAALWVGPFYHISFHSEFGSPVLDKSLLRGVFWGHTQT